PSSDRSAHDKVRVPKRKDSRDHHSGGGNACRRRDCGDVRQLRERRRTRRADASTRECLRRTPVSGVDTVAPAPAALLAVLLTFIFGQVLVKLYLEPAIELRRLIGAIAHDLDYYRNALYFCEELNDEMKERVREGRRRFRQHACKIRELLNIVRYHRWV